MKIDLPYLSEEPDSRGNVRLYVRRNGRRVRLVHAPGSPDFMAEYQAALAKLDGVALKKATGSYGTLAWLLNEYEHSHDFLKISARERRVRHAVFESLMNEETKAGSGKMFRDCPIAVFTPDHVRLLRDRKKSKPAAANKRVKFLRVALAWGAEDRSSVVKRNVAQGVKLLSYETDGYHTWTEEEVAKYEERHKVGTMARLAFDLMLYTGARRSDAVVLGPKHLIQKLDPQTGKSATWIDFTPIKTSTTTGKELSLPLLDVLRASLAATPHGFETFLVTMYGKPFSSSNSFGNWFEKRVIEAKLPSICTPHGLRKIGAVRAAENGATEQQMMAIFGWDSPKLAAHYAKKASQKKMAGAAMHMLIGKS